MILKELEVLCFDTDLEVVILKKIHSRTPPRYSSPAQRTKEPRQKQANKEKDEQNRYQAVLYAVLLGVSLHEEPWHEPRCAVTPMITRLFLFRVK